MLKKSTNVAVKVAATPVLRHFESSGRTFTASPLVEGLAQPENVTYRAALISLRRGTTTFLRTGVLSETDLDYYNGNAGVVSIHYVAVPDEHAANPWEYYSREVAPFEVSPWWSLGALMDNWERWAEHLPAPSETQRGLLSYFQTPEKRARGVRTTIKPGKYLKKYFADILDEAQIHDLALRWSNEYGLRKLNIATDADEIEQVYAGRYNGSCMHFGSKNYAGPCHPARFYAAGDLAVAYIGEADHCDGRCLIWPEKKVYFPTFYGDGPRLEASLIDKGYTSGTEEDFEGARLLRIEHNDRYVAPYLDVCGRVVDDGEHLILTADENGILCHKTNGLPPTLQTCDDCHDPLPEDDYYITVDNRYICDCCRGDYFICDVSDELYHQNEAADTPDEYSAAQGEVERAVARGSWYECEGTERFYPVRDSAGYSPITLGDGRMFLRSYAVENGFYECAYSGEWSDNVTGACKLCNGEVIDPQSFTSIFTLFSWLSANNLRIIGRDEYPDQTEMELAA